MSQGKTKFTKRELETIRILINQKCRADKSNQKIIRNKLRNELNFYITDFADKINSVEEFDKLVENGVIKCSEASRVLVNKQSLCEGRKSSILNERNSVIHHKAGLDAVVGKNAKILILGTLPGDKSLGKQEYYSNSGNRFWKIIYSLFGEKEIHNDYCSRVEFLKKHEIGMWDILSNAKREGSLDQNIKDGQANDINGLLEKFPTIKVIAFNGKEPRKLFNKYFPSGLINKEIKLITLLSSSSANNKYSISAMLEDWKEILL